MAINAKIVLIFNQSRWGWTETYYWTSTGGGLKEAVAASGELMASRRQLLSKDVVMEAARVSAVGSPGTSTTSFNVFDANNVSTIASQEPWEAFLVGLAAVDDTGIFYNRKIMLRGVPAAWNTWVSNPAQAGNLNGVFRVAINSFLNFLLAPTTSGGLWSIRASNRKLTANPRIPIGTVTISTPGNNFIVTGRDDNLLFVKGDRVHVSGARGPGTRGINADAYVTATASGVISLSTSQKCPGETVFLQGKPVIYARAYVFLPISGFQLERWVKRDTGRPFFGTAGRRGSARC